MDATPTEEQLHAFRQDGIGHAMIQVEKLLCELLGREWSAGGMSVDSLARELAASHTGVDQLAALLPGTYYTDPPDGGNVSVTEQLRRMAEDAAMWRNHKGAIESLSRAPIDMVLHCPKCGKQHIDEPEFDDMSQRETWTNPPHRTHFCSGCKFKWRPADVPTNGVAAVKTTGKNDSPIASRAPAEPECVPCVRCGHKNWVQPPTESAGPAPADYSEQLTKAKNLLVRLWDCHPSTRPMIEGATGSWFAWGTNRDAALGESHEG